MASFLGGAAIQLLSVHSGHGQTCCWHDPVANDPISDIRPKSDVSSFFCQTSARFPGPSCILGSERVERGLAAVLAADVAGYSRYTEADEEGTLARLRLFGRHR